jgi:UDP-N-acetylglucosamine 2-epimerase (non-hydrolysing)
MVGTDVEAIYGNVKTLLTDDHEYAKMATKVNPYGDGKAVSRIVSLVKEGVS